MYNKELLNMNVNETIKYETEKRINQFKEGAKAKGIPLTAMEEMYFKMGISYGIAIAGIGLANFDGAELFKEIDK